MFQELSLHSSVKEKSRRLFPLQYMICILDNALITLPVASQFINDIF